MIKIKKLLAAVTAGAMMLSMSISASAVGDFVPTADGYYTADMVEAMNYYEPDNYSMCNGVFAGEADVTIDGDWATLHLYVCNPTPTYGGLDTGILTGAYITYDDVTYDGELTSIGYENENAAVKLFTQDSSFFGIVNATSYTSDTMEFTIPTAALASNIEISAVVNLVMGNRNSFLLDINWLGEASDDDNGEVTTTQSMKVTATVAKNISTSSAVIPESTDMGTLSKSEDTVVRYAVEVNEGYGQSVTVTADESVTLTAGNATLTITNDFDGENGTLTASAEEVAAVAIYEGDLKFEGSLSFTIVIA